MRAHRLGRQDVFSHRLEGRLRQRASCADRGARPGSPIPRLHHAPNLQRAVAVGLRQDDDYFEGLGRQQQEKRDRLSAGLSAAGFSVQPSAGTYFLVADYRPLGFNEPDEAFCQRLVEEAGVAAIPLSAFYRDAEPTGFVRFCFCKQDSVLDEAAARLRRRFGRTPSPARQRGAPPEHRPSTLAQLAG